MKFLQNFKSSTNNFNRLSRKVDIDEPTQKEALYKSLEGNIIKVKKTLGESKDIIIREFYIGEDSRLKIAIIYTDGLVDKAFVQEFILQTLMIDSRKVNYIQSAMLKEDSFEVLNNFFLPIGELHEISHFESLFLHLLSGDTIILIEGYDRGFAASSKGWAERGINEPSSQTVVRGPKEGFSETLSNNIALIRRKIKDPSLWVEIKDIGKRTKTDVAVVYIKGVAKDDIINELHNRLDEIDVDGILEGGYIEEYIQHRAYSPFPTVFNTERPDVVAGGLLEGRIAILVDGTPFVLLVPALFVQFFQSSEDYYQRFDISSLTRLLRYFCFFLNLLTPALFVAITTFHQEMLPTPLLINIAAQREGIPFPAIVEAFMMEITFEILREAGIRMPRAVGSAISIVGALVIGEAAVEAGLVTPIKVIIVSITAMSSFVLPAFNMSIAVRMVRFVFLILGGTFGLYGIVLGLIIMVLHLCSIRSMGVPYMYPMAPFSMEDQKDTMVRFPLWKIFKRPGLINQNDVIRGKEVQENKLESNNQEK